MLAFWDPASRLLPLHPSVVAARRGSSSTRSTCTSFATRAAMLGAGRGLDERFGELGGRRAQHVPRRRRGAHGSGEGGGRCSATSSGPSGPTTCRSPSRSRAPRSRSPNARGSSSSATSGTCPNGEAVEYLCRDILPRLDPELLAAHPLTVVGSRLDEKVRAHGRGLPGVNMVGWVPSIVPVSGTGAGVRGADAARGRRQGQDRRVADGRYAGGDDLDRRRGHGPAPPRARRDRGLAGRPRRRARAPAHRRATSGSGSPTPATSWPRRPTTPTGVRDRFLEIVDEVLSLPPARARADDGIRGPSAASSPTARPSARSPTTLAAITDAGPRVLVVSRGDDSLVDVDGRTGLALPAGARRPLGRLPPCRQRDGDPPPGGACASAAPATCVSRARRSGGCTTIASSPPTSRRRYRRIHSSEHLVVFDLGDEAPSRTRRAARPAAAPAGARPRHLRRGRAGPPPSARRRARPQPALRRSRSAGVHRRADAAERRARAAETARTPTGSSTSATPRVLPAGFLDDFLTTALGAGRAWRRAASRPTRAGPRPAHR